jgi:hypothetical protein
MKNKHLVFIFLLTLALGLLARRLPWRVSEMFQTDLIEIDTSALLSISITRPGSAELLLERTDMGWVADQDGRPVLAPKEDIDPMLEALAHVQTLRIVKTKQPDTLGLAQAISVKAAWADGGHEVFHIGRQTLENAEPATYIELDDQRGIYLVKKHLRDVFDKDAAQFRKKTALHFVTDSISSISFFWARQDSIYFLQKNDSLRVWEYGTIRRPDDSVRLWLQLLPRLNGSPFADHFDDTRARETLITRVTLQSNPGATPLVLRFFYFAPPDLPDDLSNLGNERHNLSAWVLHSSQNPYNYFSITDTTLLRRIFYDLSR